MNKIRIGDFLEEYSLKAKKYNREIEGVRLLLLEYLELKEVDFLLNNEIEIENKKIDSVISSLNRYIVDGIPCQYILGYAYFYSRKFIVNSSVLIPRFDTEVLIEAVLNNTKGNESVVDIGTGSGVIACTLKLERNGYNVDAVDISKEAIDVAKLNACNFKLDINFIENDLLKGLGKYDVIVSNPPYISTNTKVDELVYNNEPHLALFASDNGLFFYKEILKEAKNNLNKEGKIFFEIGYDQKDDIMILVKEIFPEKEVDFIKDYGGNYRVAYIHN